MTDAPQRKRRGLHDAYPLRTVTVMTGLTPDLIRAWEKRYGVVRPVRGARGARLYTAADIAHLRALARVVATGRAIGDVAALSRAQLDELAGSQPLEGARAASRSGIVAQVLAHLAHFDQPAVAAVLGDALVGLGPRTFVHEVALPIVEEVGTAWAKGSLSVGEEHVFTATLRTLLDSLIQQRARTGRAIMLAAPTGERHELGLLLVGLLILECGGTTLHLGVDLPAADIIAAVRRVHPRVIGLSVVSSENRDNAAREVVAIQEQLPTDVELWLGGADAAHVATRAKSDRAVVVTSLHAAESELARIVGR